MIQNLFTVNAFIKDYDKSEAWSQELTLAARAIFQNHLAQGDKTYETLGDDEIAFYSREYQSVSYLKRIARVICRWFL